MKNNKFFISSAGSGKTTLLVNEALNVCATQSVLITTFTEDNEQEIRDKFVEENGCVPSNVHVQTWFTFLLRNGVRPYQSVLCNDLQDEKIGFILTEEKSGLKYKTAKGFFSYYGESDFKKHYFTNTLKIYSDKLSKFVLNADNKINGEIINRISRIYQHIYIDEAQDMAGYDLEIIKKLLLSDMRVLLSGDPRQVIYLTHPTSKHPKYKNGGLSDFIKEKCPTNSCEIDSTTLSTSHRNNKEICSFSSTLFPEFPASISCTCSKCISTDLSHEGVFLITKRDVKKYIEIYKPQVLRYSNAGIAEITFGKSKGRSFKRVLIYPTKKMSKYLKTGNIEDIESVRAKFYVAITRARQSATIILDSTEGEYIDGVQVYRNWS